MTTALLMALRDQVNDVLDELISKLPPTVYEGEAITRALLRRLDNDRRVCLYTYAQGEDFSRMDVFPIKAEYWPTLVPLAQYIRRLDSYIAANKERPT